MLNTRKDCNHRVKFISGRKKAAKRFTARRARRLARRALCRDLRREDY